MKNFQLFTKELLSDIHQKAAQNTRKRVNYDLRNSAEDTSQRMLNALEVGTHVPIHRHLKTSETVVCMDGCPPDWTVWIGPYVAAFRIVHGVCIVCKCHQELVVFRRTAVWHKEQFDGVGRPKPA